MTTVLGPTRAVVGPWGDYGRGVVSESTDDPQGPQIEEMGNA